MEFGAELGIEIDVLGIGEAISQGIVSSNNREGFVKDLANSAYYAAGERYNVMVFNLSQPHEERFNGVQFYGSATYDGVIYGIWTFDDGEFFNQGDGGFINWCFIGTFTRDGDQGHHVVFTQ